jgi:hypothetical protein
MTKLFDDKDLVLKIKRGLPNLFNIAESECSRAGKIGMEVGSIRERIIVALLIHIFGIENVETEIGITEPEIDVHLFGNPVSIKTVTSAGYGGVKLIWTVDAAKAQEFRKTYYPKCDIILVRINWNEMGGLYYIPLEVKKRLFDKIGRENYIKLPKPGTNPRGVEFNKDALYMLISDKNSKRIIINWERQDIEFNPYARWVELWEKK